MPTAPPSTPPWLVSLPVLGVGASLSLGTTPDAATLVRTPGGPSFIEYAGRVSVQSVLPEVNRIRAAGAPVLFHPSYINFCGTFPNSAAWLDETARHATAVGSAWFAQDVAYCFWGEHAGYSTQLGYFVPPLWNAASLAAAITRVREVKARVQLPVAIEPPPLTFVAGRIPVLTFLSTVADEADCALLLDAGHIASYARAAGRTVIHELDALAHHRVLELHVAGGRLAMRGGKTFYVDAHDEPILDETWDMLDALLPRLPELRAVCVECEGTAASSVLSTLGRVRARVRALSSHPALVERVRSEDATGGAHGPR